MADSEINVTAAESSDAEMPTPPDLSTLFQEQRDKLNNAYKESSKAFDVFNKRDVAFAALTTAYQQEIVQVLTIAKAVTTPVTAIASIPVVLAAANAAFAKAPVTEQTVTALIEEAFSAFKTE
ncbi:MAG: hypothetical protein JKX94_08885 [Sneathiella sp.]|nr:hypothetical protein [Sneathiella sp.]